MILTHVTNINLIPSCSNASASLPYCRRSNNHTSYAPQKPIKFICHTSLITFIWFRRLRSSPHESHLADYGSLCDSLHFHFAVAMEMNANFNVYMSVVFQSSVQRIIVGVSFVRLTAISIMPFFIQVENFSR